MSETHTTETTEERKPPTIADIVREKTDDGAIIIDFFTDVMTGRIEGAELCHRMDAAKHLVKYGHKGAAEFLAKNRGIPCGHSTGGRPDSDDPCTGDDAEERTPVIVDLIAPPTLTPGVPHRALRNRRVPHETAHPGPDSRRQHNRRIPRRRNARQGTHLQDPPQASRRQRANSTHPPRRSLHRRSGAGRNPGGRRGSQQRIQLRPHNRRPCAGRDPEGRRGPQQRSQPRPHNRRPCAGRDPEGRRDPWQHSRNRPHPAHPIRRPREGGDPEGRPGGVSLSLPIIPITPITRITVQTPSRSPRNQQLETRIPPDTPPPNTTHPKTTSLGRKRQGRHAQKGPRTRSPRPLAPRVNANRPHN